MIQTDFTTIISIYLFILVLIPLALWSLFEFSQSARFKKVNIKKSFRQCSICTHVYEASKDETISMCPRCKSYNSKEGT